MKRILSVCLILALLLSLAACGSAASNVESVAPTTSEISAPEVNEAPEADPVEEASVEEASAEETELIEEPIELPEPGADFPLVDDGSVDISVWFASPPFASMMGDYATCDTWYFFKDFSAMTGLSFSFTYSAFDATTENFALMVASNDYTELVSGNRYSNGVDAAINDEVYLALNDLIEEYSPYYAQQLQRPEVRKDAVTEAGNIGLYYALYDTEGIVSSGTAINGNLLENWENDLPETYAEYEEFLAYLQTQGVTYPIFRSPIDQIIASGYNNLEDWVVIDGKVQYGLVNDESKEFYTLMADWYQKEYIPADYYTTAVFDNQNQVYASITDGSAGVSFAAADAIGAYPDANLTPLHIMVKEEGGIVHTYAKDKPLQSEYGWALTTACDEDTQMYLAKAIDYLYTEPGSVMVTWGVEGVSFEYDENGDPHYIDAIFEEYPIPMCGYLKYATMSEIGLSDYRKVTSSLSEDELQVCLEWDETQKDDGLYPATSLTDEEQDVYATYFAEAETYIEEVIHKMISGGESIDNWDSFIDTLNSEFHLDELTDIMQASYDRYMSK